MSPLQMREQRPAGFTPCALFPTDPPRGKRDLKTALPAQETCPLAPARSPRERASGPRVAGPLLMPAGL